MLVDDLLRSIFKQDRQCTYDVTLRRVRETIVAVEKQEVSRILSVFVALGIQYAMRMRHIFRPLVDPFRSHASRILCNGLPWFLSILGSLLRGIPFAC
jgi:hypothetical protein